MTRDNIETLLVVNLVRLYDLAGYSWSQQTIKQKRQCVIELLGSKDGCVKINEELKSIASDQNKMKRICKFYTPKFINTIIKLIEIRIENEEQIKPVNLKVVDVLNKEEYNRINSHLNRNNSTVISYSALEEAGSLDKLQKILSTQLNRSIKLQIHDSIPKEYKEKTKYLNKTVWVFTPYLPVITVGLKL